MSTIFPRINLAPLSFRNAVEESLELYPLHKNIALTNQFVQGIPGGMTKNEGFIAGETAYAFDLVSNVIREELKKRH
ncbi:MAG: hypothetical protein WC178_00845 [Candidatus Paceibacterota bacterium]